MEQVRVAHFEPNKITLSGVGVFPRVVFDLPHDKEDFRYEELTQQARENLEREKSNLSEKSVDDVPFGALANVSTVRKKCIFMCFFLEQKGTLLPEYTVPYGKKTSISLYLSSTFSN